MPLASETNDESSRAWLCITRSYYKDSNKVHVSLETSETSEIPSSDQFRNSDSNILNGSSDTSNNVSHKPALLAGKRKERS